MTTGTTVFHYFVLRWRFGLRLRVRYSHVFSERGPVQVVGQKGCTETTSLSIMFRDVSWHLRIEIKTPFSAASNKQCELLGETDIVAAISLVAKCQIDATDNTSVAVK